MPQPPIFEWHGREYAGPEKSRDWFWALGIIALALVVVCILLNNWLLALLVIVASIVVALQAARHPRIHRFTINEGGLTIDEHPYHFKDMLHFSVLEYVDPTKPPALSIKTKHFLAPHLLIPIIGYDPVDVYHYIAMHLPEGKHDESFMDHLVNLIGL